MVKFIIGSMCMLLLVSCGKQETIKINTDVKVQKTEVLYCPAPPEISRPTLPIHTMTSKQRRNDGEVVKHWKATVKVLMGYSQELETVVNKQKEINKVYEDKKKADAERPVTPTEE